MALPAAYDENTLLAFMGAELGATGVSLGLEADAQDTLAEARNEALGILGAPLAGLTSNADLMKVRAIARWQAWLAASTVAAGNHDLKAGTSDLKQSQVFEMIQARLSSAERAASRYSEVQAYAAGGSTACVSSITTAGSPYDYAYDEWT